MDGSAITLTSLQSFIADAVSIFLVIASLAVVAGIAYAGFTMATAGGDEAKFKKGKTMLWQVIIGGAVIFGVGLIVNTIADFAQQPTQIFR
jgi:hypothetical protein